MKLLKLYFVFILAFIGTFSFSQSYQDLQRLQEEYKKVLEKQALQKPAEIDEAEKRAKSTALPDKLVYSRKDIESLLINTEKLLQELKFLKDTVKKMPYFGYDFFTKRDSIPFWQNLPISKNYILGPGDEIIIALWGESNSLSTEIINRDGQIFIENIGVINLSGKSVLEAKKLITSRYSRVYSTLIGQKPQSFIDLSLGELKSLNVHFVGYVNIPGVHMLHPFSNVITGLIQAGGVNNRGTLRNIQIIRNGETINEVDFYDYVLNVKELTEIRLMDQDIIHVGPRISTVAIDGSVLKPGYYELTKNESLKDLLFFSGGKERFSSNLSFVFRNNYFEKNGFLISDNEGQNFTVMQGDSIFVPKINNHENFINIQGHVKNPGKYPFNKKMVLKNLINATMSPKDQDFYKSMDLSNITIFRKNPLESDPVKIVTSLDDNSFLKSGYHIVVNRKNILNPIESVIITGEINNPGMYPVNNITTLADILNKAGGFTSFALQKGVEIFRDSVRIGWENDKFVLNQGDSLNVRKKTGLIFISGEVNNPGYLSYDKSNSIKNYIRKAGGFTSFAQIDNIYIIYPNGISKPANSWLTPKVIEGSSIIVGQRTITGNQKPNGWEVFSLIAGQAGNIATTLLSISLLLNQTNAN